MANAYVYQWSLRPRPDICIELRIEASDAIEARREVVAFLRRHGAAGWQIEAVHRMLRPAPEPVRGVQALPTRP